MSLRRIYYAADADWRPHPFAVVGCVAGVAMLAWGVYVYAQTPVSQGGAELRAEPWRPAPSKWSRAPTSGGQRLSTASMSVAAPLPTPPVAPPLPKAPE